MDRSNPYEAAFEGYLQAHRLCYVAVDETRRSLLGDTPVKNLDFIVLGPAGARLLIDIKGRRFPGGPPGKERYVWENWSTLEDVEGLIRWMKIFGSGYEGLFVFMYRILPTVDLSRDTPDVWTWQDQRFLLRAVPALEYRRHMRQRSPRWRTVGLPAKDFRRLARPFFQFSQACQKEEDTLEDWHSCRDWTVDRDGPFADCTPGNTAAGSGRD